MNNKKKKARGVRKPEVRRIDLKNKERNFECELPRGYREVLHVSANKKSTAVWLTLGSLVITAVIFVLLLIPIFKSGVDISDVSPAEFFIFYGVFILAMLAYIILHELTHGLFYKLTTGRKLTFGITPVAAFCGVPDVYVYRSSAMLAVLAPLVIWSIIFAPMLPIVYALSPLYYIGLAFVFALHIGGCIGDGYVTLLLLTRFKSDAILIRDTGPEQFFYSNEKQK